MKTIILIAGVAATFLVAQGNKAQEKKETSTVSAAYSDSLHEAGRVEMMRSRMK